SPRPLPGQPKGQYLATGVEHNEFGKVSEDPKNRVAMMDKRRRKIPTDPREMGLSGIKYNGPEAPDLLLIGIGPTYGPTDDARGAVAAEVVACGHAHVRVLAPPPVGELGELMGPAPHDIVDDNDQNGQLFQPIDYIVGKALREAGVV